jgi:hypothetical protein
MEKRDCNKRRKGQWSREQKKREVLREEGEEYKETNFHVISVSVMIRKLSLKWIFSF